MTPEKSIDFYKESIIQTESAIRQMEAELAKLEAGAV